MKMYVIKIALSGMSPMIWRRLRIPGHISLADFHHVIQIVFNWDNEHLHRFHIYGKDYGVAYAGGLSFSDDAHSVFIDDFGFDVGDRFVYEYNFFESWLHDIRVEAIEARVTSPAFSFCVKGKGMPGATRYDEVEGVMDLIKVIINSDESTKVGDIRDQIEALDTVWFNRKKVNHHLATLSI